MVECLCSEVLLRLGNIVITLGSEISSLEGSKSFLLCFLLGFIESVGDLKNG